MGLASYLLIADDKIDLGTRQDKAQSLKAHLKYSLLFEEKILLTDAHFLRNDNLHHLIESGDGFIELFTQDNLILALRDYIDFAPVKNGKTYNKILNPNLNEILKCFMVWDKNRWKTNSSYNDDLPQMKTIDLIRDRCEVKRYDYFDILGTYTNDVLRLFDADSTREKLGDNIINTIIKLATEKRDLSISDVNPKGGLVPGDFKNEMANEFEKLGMKNEWSIFEDQILELSGAPYLTAFPKVMNANPIYGKMHRHKVELLNQSSRKKGITIGEIRSYKTRLLRFEEGIIRLSPDSIFRLRESEEFKDYRKSIILYNDSDTSIYNVLNALENYKNKIDDEIMLNFPYLKESKKYTREKFNVIDIINESAAYGGVILAGMAVASTSFFGVSEIGLGLGLLNLYLTKVLNHFKKNEVNENEVLKMELNNTLTNQPASEEIISEHILNKTSSGFSIESFYDSVD